MFIKTQQLKQYNNISEQRLSFSTPLCLIKANTVRSDAARTANVQNHKQIPL